MTVQSILRVRSHDTSSCLSQACDNGLIAARPSNIRRCIAIDLTHQWVKFSVAKQQLPFLHSLFDLMGPNSVQQRTLRRIKRRPINLRVT